MAYHRTAAFKAHDPSGRKLRRVKKMQQRYSSAYSNILRELKGCEDETLGDLASAKSSIVGDYFEWLIGEQPLESAMWTGLIKDIQQSIDTYLDTPGANFPAPAGTSAEPIGELLDELLSPVTRQEEEELKAEIKRKSKTYARPINFTRYRNNPIIRSEDGEKMWVAPHLQKREDDKTGALPPNGNSVRPGNWSYSTNSYHWKRQSNKETLPIELSRWHMHRFFREGTPKSSKVHVVGDNIYVYYANQGLNYRNGLELLLSVIQFLCGPVQRRVSSHKHRFYSTPDSHLLLFRLRRAQQKIREGQSRCRNRPWGGDHRCLQCNRRQRSRPRKRVVCVGISSDKAEGDRQGGQRYTRAWRASRRALGQAPQPPSRRAPPNQQRNHRRRQSARGGHCIRGPREPQWAR